MARASRPEVDNRRGVQASHHIVQLLDQWLQTSHLHGALPELHGQSAEQIAQGGEAVGPGHQGPALPPRCPQLRRCLRQTFHNVTRQCNPAPTAKVGTFSITCCRHLGQDEPGPCQREVLSTLRRPGVPLEAPATHLCRTVQLGQLQQDRAQVRVDSLEVRVQQQARLQLSLGILQPSLAQVIRAQEVPRASTLRVQLQCPPPMLCGATPAITVLERSNLPLDVGPDEQRGQGAQASLNHNLQRGLQETQDYLSLSLLLVPLFQPPSPLRGMSCQREGTQQRVCGVGLRDVKSTTFRVREDLWQGTAQGFVDIPGVPLVNHSRALLRLAHAPRSQIRGAQRCLRQLPIGTEKFRLEDVAFLLEDESHPHRCIVCCAHRRALGVPNRQALGHCNALLGDEYRAFVAPPVQLLLLHRIPVVLAALPLPPLLLDCLPPWQKQQGAQLQVQVFQSPGDDNAGPTKAIAELQDNLAVLQLLWVLDSV
mmetsp:Transcript_90720/g.292834  ORF Transcript_90720/g.292834 Transcript_90720/m.292834 type:complete len:482 (-) Transcript_90720:1530-2975(-)